MITVKKPSKEALEALKGKSFFKHNFDKFKFPFQKKIEQQEEQETPPDPNESKEKKED